MASDPSSDPKVSQLSPPRTEVAVGTANPARPSFVEKARSSESIREIGHFRRPQSIHRPHSRTSHTPGKLASPPRLFPALPKTAPRIPARINAIVRHVCLDVVVQNKGSAPQKCRAVVCVGYQVERVLIRAPSQRVSRHRWHFPKS